MPADSPGRIEREIVELGQKPFGEQLSWSLKHPLKSVVCGVVGLHFLLKLLAARRRQA